MPRHNHCAVAMGTSSPHRQGPILLHVVFIGAEKALQEDLIRKWFHGERIQERPNSRFQVVRQWRNKSYCLNFRVSDWPSTEAAVRPLLENVHAVVIMHDRRKHNCPTYRSFWVPFAKDNVSSMTRFLVVEMNETDSIGPLTRALNDRFAATILKILDSLSTLSVRLNMSDDIENYKEVGESLFHRAKAAHMQMTDAAPSMASLMRFD